MTYTSPLNEHWYVAARDTRGRHGLLVGPFPDHSGAAEHVEPVHRACRSLLAGVDDSWWFSYGVARVVDDAPPVALFGGPA